MNSLELEVFDADLAVVARSPCLTIPGVASVSVLAVATGWLVAYDTSRIQGGESELYLQRYDARANPIGGAGYVAAGHTPQLVAGDGDSAVLIYQAEEISLFALMLHADGTPASDRQFLFRGRAVVDYLAVRWVGDAFLIAVQEFRAAGDGISIARLERDGTVHHRTTRVGMDAVHAQLVFDGASPSLAFADATGIRVQPLDRAGNSVGGAVELGPRSPGEIHVAWHAGRYVLLDEDLAAPIRVRAFDRDFHQWGTEWNVGRPIEGPYRGRMLTASLGSRLIVAWSDGVGSWEGALAIAAIEP